MRNKSKLVCGIGVNDADYPVYVCSVIAGKQKNLWTCPFYKVWASMLDRCYSTKSQASKPTYIGCSVAPEWHSFSTFRAWMLVQDWEGKQLDKDMLAPGNKLYGADTCVFVSGQLNKFMTDSGATRGDRPTGVTWRKGSGKFQARCRNPLTKKVEHLGLFDCPNAAHEAWRSRKHELACIYAEMQTDPRISAALRTRYAGAGQAVEGACHA